MSDEQKRNTELLVVSIDPKPDLQKMADKISREDGRKPDFPFLSDPGHRVIDRYGLLNLDDPRGIPHPTTYVIDRRGIVRWKFTEVNYKVRPTNEMILHALEGLR
ncbi:MAG: redoxin domain-containing protein [Gemmatimonadetes bacterium]|nr:redoxin domain-containing protein [Gemmatimonadota bacterium]